LALGTKFDSRKATLRGYKVRMWIEEMFGDMKKHGFNLESSRLRSFQKLSRLTFAVVFYIFGLLPLVQK